MLDVYGSAATGTTISLMNNLITGVEVAKSHRGNGYARKWMEVVCLDADLEDMVLYLALEPQEREVDLTRLRNFYSSLGFRVLSEDPDQRVMKRVPNKPPLRAVS